MIFEWIEWSDAASQDEWVNESHIEPGTHDIGSMGILVEENDEVVVLALNLDRTAQNYSCIMHIPKAIIRTRVRLEGFHPMLKDLADANLDQSVSTSTDGQQLPGTSSRQGKAYRAREDEIG